MPAPYPIAPTPLVEFDVDRMTALIRAFTPRRIASFLDVTDLKADTQPPKMAKMADWAKTLGCASVCVNPAEAADTLPLLLKGSAVKECYVHDFPLGKSDIELKARMAEHTVKKSRELRGEGKGRLELDTVINVGRFKKDPRYTLEEIDAVCQAADGETVKVIVRSSELSEEEVWRVSEVVAQSKAHFIKNSTGMDAYGAMPEHMRIMRQVMGPDRGVKAAGGISDAMCFLRLAYAGAPDPELHHPMRWRVGTSAPLAIVYSAGWLQHQSRDWAAAGVTPCLVCPYHHVDKLRVEIRELANAKCRGCGHFHYRTRKDL
jgi:deoxyribose-phosphate aldolase